MSFQQAKKLAVVAFSKDSVSGVMFRRNKEILEPVVFVREQISDKDPSIAWKSVLKQMGRGKDCPLYLTGSLRDGICFDVHLADLSPRFQKEALELELPRHLLSVSENMRFQFLPQGEPEGGFADLRVYAAPERSFEPVAAMLTQGSSHADGFIYPALALTAGDPLFFAEEMDPERSFADGVWSSGCADETMVHQWQKKLEKEVHPDPGSGFEFKDCLLHIIAARALFRNGDYAGLEILPDQLRPQRVRKQVRTTVILALLLILSFVWSKGGSWKENYLEMRFVSKDIQKYMRENADLKRRLKGKEKGQKELNRVLNLKSGEKELSGKLADLSAVLPENALVTSFRCHENGIDLQIQTVADQNKISTALRRLPYWKVAQLQQRRWGNSTSTVVTLKLIPAEVKK